MKTAKNQEVIEVREKFEQDIQEVTNSISDLLQPLKKLTIEQRNSVVILGIIIENSQYLKRPGLQLNKILLKELKSEIDKYCPPLGQTITSKDPCLQADIGYISALARCKSEGRKEEECFEAWGFQSQLLKCSIERIGKMKMEIGNILTGRIFKT